MSAITRLGFFGYGVRPAGSFLRLSTPEVPVNLANVATTDGLVTRLATVDSLVGRVAMSDGLVTRLSTADSLVGRVATTDGLVTNATVTEWPV